MAVEPLIYELSKPGRRGVRFPETSAPQREVPAGLQRSGLNWPEVSEIDVIRHFTRMSQKNHGVDTGFYPLGSCTMKYNPKINEEVSRYPGFSRLHPYLPESMVQGAMGLMYELQEMLAEIAGFHAVTLQPAAGAHGELTGSLIIRACHAANGDTKRTKMLIPDSAHGTNPATAVMAGFQVVTVPSDDRGNTDLEALKGMLGDDIAGMMITNPNTLGLWDEHVVEIIDAVHDCGGMVYNDGANFNAILGCARPGDLGFDVMHYNLHKTFSTPHGGGGPGSGPVGVRKGLEGFLPGPCVRKGTNGYEWYMPEQSIGRLHSFNGNFGMHVRAYTYIRMHGAEGLRQVSEDAVLNANYLMHRIDDTFDVAFKRSCMHEFVVSGDRQAKLGAKTIDMAKRMLDFGVHPPTTYFPLIVHEALMIEPTETESKETLDFFADMMLQIAHEVETEPEKVTSAPHNTEYKRLDEVGANRNPNQRWRPEHAAAN